MDKTGHIKFPVFSYPLMCFEDETNIVPHKEWKKIAGIVLGQDNGIPL